MRNTVKLWAVGIAVAVLVIGGAYVVGSLVGRAQMSAQSPAAQTDPMVRIAAALERIAAAMEKSAGGSMSGMMGGMMQGMGQMGMMGDMSQMMAQMQERMKQCQAMMGQMQGMMSSPVTQPAPSAPTQALTEADLTRTSQAEGITVAVTFMNPLLKPEEVNGKLVFKVALDTHTVDLSQFDLTKLAVLRTSEGVTVSEGFSWEPESESGHHRKGVLKVADTLNGAPLITRETKWLELELKEIGMPSRVFRWEGQVLTALAR
uniref:Hypothetical conserved protein n=1 Tax=Acetithermum autotrophicum TaxID=1446466 RepID=H5SUZ3_ACEAU|nr:hypothetical conserved protein [Candidatus Acetothermum autotrophicum]